jgi:hypothetical protein
MLRARGVGRPTGVVIRRVSRSGNLDESRQTLGNGEQVPVGDDLGDLGPVDTPSVEA